MGEAWATWAVGLIGTGGLVAAVELGLSWLFSASDPGEGPNP